MSKPKHMKVFKSLSMEECKIHPQIFDNLAGHYRKCPCGVIFQRERFSQYPKGANNFQKGTNSEGRRVEHFIFLNLRKREKRRKNQYSKCKMNLDSTEERKEMGSER